MFVKVLTACLVVYVAKSENVKEGVKFGNPDAPLHIEAYYDLLSPESKASNKVLNQVLGSVDTMFDSRIIFSLHRKILLLKRLLWGSGSSSIKC